MLERVPVQLHLSDLIFLHQKEMETQIAASSSPCIVDVVQSLALENKFC